MHSTPELATAFLRHLEVEEQLVLAAHASLADVAAALRTGDLGAMASTREHQESLANQIHQSEGTRTELANRLAAAVGLPAVGLTLATLADHLSDPWATELRAARHRLTVATQALAELQQRNANLIGHLRSYFRGVMSALTVADAPVRYGPSGGRLAPGSSGAIQANG